MPDVIASPLSLFDAVHSGDVSAVEQVLHLDLNQIDKVFIFLYPCLEGLIRAKKGLEP